MSMSCKVVYLPKSTLEIERKSCWSALFNGLKLLLGATLLAAPISIASAQDFSPNTSAQSQVQTRDASTPTPYNPFDAKQIESLLDHGRHLQEEGKHTEALAILDKAWQVNRINYGLYHESQLSILESIIDSQIELADWQGANDRYDYLEQLYRRLYDKNDSRLEQGLRLISLWHVNAANIDLEGKRINHLRKARQVFKLRLEVAELTLAADHPKIDFLRESIAISEQQLYLASSLNQEISRSHSRARRDRLLAGID